MADRPRQAPPVALTVFGASGDLAGRKLFPALARLAAKRQLADEFAVVGVARTPMTDDEFRDRALATVTEPSPEWIKAVAGFRYVAGEYGDANTFRQLAEVLAALDQERGTAGNRVFYLATVPDVFGTVATALGGQGLDRSEQGFARLVVEKPFGRDLESSRRLNEVIHAVFAEAQVYRIDHYLAKETVQNVLALRFANAIFEPVWNRRYVDHVQITVAETLGVAHRGAFYETAGALRDIVQNHVMQVLALTLMEPPPTVHAERIRDEKVKLLRAIDAPTVEEVPAAVVRAQYSAGVVDGEQVVGYTEEPDVTSDSQTETFVALRLHVDNWRWAGVPFYVRTGKRLPNRVTEVVARFHDVPHLAFAAGQAEGLGPNLLILRIQPDEGITLRIGAKVPGQEFELRSVSLDFSYAEAFAEQPPDAYERLLFDVMIGDPTLFIRADEVEQSWRVVDPILKAWAQDETPIVRYRAGTWGPPAAAALLAHGQDSWYNP